MNLSEELRSLLLSGGAAEVGFADLSPLGEGAGGGLRRGIALILPLMADVVAEARGSATAAFRGELVRASEQMKTLHALASRRLGELGFRCIRADEATGPDGQPARVSFKVVATLAGLGWIGRSGLLVTPRYGPAVRLWAMLTDAPLICDRPVRASQCSEKCHACERVCPPSAIRGLTWQPGTVDMVDTRACRAHGLAMAEQLGLNHPTCGLCLTNCPLTLAYLARGGQRVP